MEARDTYKAIVRAVTGVAAGQEDAAVEAVRAIVGTKAEAEPKKAREKRGGRDRQHRGGEDR